MGIAADNPSAPSGQLLLHKGAFFSRDTQSPAKLKAPPIRTSKGQSSTAPERPTCSIEEQRGDAQEGNTSWVLFGSFSQRERTRTLSALWQMCRHSQSAILSQCNQAHTAQVTPLKFSRHTPAACGETQNTQALPQNIRPLALSVTCGDSSPRGRAKERARLRRCISRSSQSLCPFGAAPFTQGSLIRQI